MINNYYEIFHYLKDHYFEVNDTPDWIISSHWRKMHEFTRISSSKQMENATGQGFGFFPHMTISKYIFSWLTIICYLVVLSNRLELIKLTRKGISIAKQMGHPFTYDCFRQICTYALLYLHVQGNRYLMIGDGIGFLSVFIKTMNPKAHLCLVDLGKTLYFQAMMASRVHPNISTKLITEHSTTDISDISDNYEFIFLSSRASNYAA